jgi:hypothetical protein
MIDLTMIYMEHGTFIKVMKKHQYATGNFKNIFDKY